LTAIKGETTGNPGEGDRNNLWLLFAYMRNDRKLREDIEKTQKMA